MNAGRIELIPQEVQQLIAADYQAGKKLREIQEAHNVTRSQVYWVLEQQSVAPERTKPKSRLDDGDPVTMEKLYGVLEAQDERIRFYQRVLREITAAVDLDERSQIHALVDEVAPYLEPHQP